MTIVIDASVALAWLLPDETSDAADKILQEVEVNGAIAPTFFKAECANVLAISVRRKRIDASTRADALSFLSDLGIEFDDEALHRCWSDVVGLAEDHDLTIYDAMYLETALRNRLPLATFDKGLKRSANECKVRLFM